MKKYLLDEKIQISIVLFTLFLYIISKNIIFAYLIAIEIFFFIFYEIKEGIKKRGIKGEFIDTLKSFGYALGIWLVISIIFRSPVPISGIVSCSMVPSFHRGDLVLVYGLNPEEINIPEINMSKKEYFSFVYSPTKILYNSSSFIINGSIFSYCYSYPNAYMCQEFFNHPNKFVEQRGNFTFFYKMCKRQDIGKNTYILQPCLDHIMYKNKSYYMNYSNPVIVYEPDKGTLFSYIGDIIHRAYLKLNVEDEMYFLTKGDNNNILDIQFYDYKHHLFNFPAHKIKGIQVFTIPYIGYLKLFISGYMKEDPICNTYLIDID